MSRPSSLSGSQNLSSASDEQESQYLLKTRRLHWVRIALSVIIALAAVAVVGCEGHSLFYYNQTHSSEKWGPFVWPKYIDLRPTYSLIASGGIITALTVFYTAVSILPSPHPRTILLNALASIISLIGLVAAISAVVFIAHLPTSIILDGISGETIHMWTCTWVELGGKDPQGVEIISLSDFNRLCTETRGSFVLMCLLIGLEAVFGAVVGWSWWLAFGIEKKRNAAFVGLGTVTEIKA